MEYLLRVDDRFPVSFYYRLADQLINQAKEFRDEHKITHLYTTLAKYCNLISTIPQHPSYTIYSPKEKLRHNKLHQESIKELERLKPQIAPHALPTKLSSVHKGNVEFSSSITKDSTTGCSVYESPCSTFSTNVMDCTVNVHFVTQSSPSLVLSYVEDVPQAASISHINVADDSTHEYPPSSYRDIHISARLMEDFLELARDNTNNDLETCGILGAFLKDEIFYVTTLIIPKQESTSSSCQALNEEEIYAIQDEHSLFPLGWIHTHPSQTCFMSSIDLHTHFSYQVMLPEAVAIVMAPTDPSRSYGIFRLSNPSGITVVKDCDERGFHTHQEPSDGRPIYEECSNVYINPNMRFEIFDLR